MSVWLAVPLLLSSLAPAAPEGASPAAPEAPVASAPIAVAAPLPPLPAAPSPEVAPAPASPARAAPEAGLPMLGLQVDAGVPDGLGASLLVRPFAPLRLHLGALHNGVSLGARVGVSLLPLRWAVRPCLTLEAGRLFDGDARGLVQRFGASVGAADSLLTRVGYDFANAHVGLELGSTRRFSFVLRGGLSYLRSTVRGAAELLQQEVPEARVLEMGDVRVRATFPSLKLGFLLYLG